MAQPEMDQDLEAIVLPERPAAPPSLEDFLSRGWCRHQVERLQQNFDAEVLSYIITLNRTGDRPNDHLACATEPHCIANDVDMRHYNIAHADSCRGHCPMVSVDYERIVEIIQGGGVPLVSISKQDNRLRLHVEPRTFKSRYTAISHVWCDGFGNPSRNAMPACQLDRFADYLRRIPPDKESMVFRAGGVTIDWMRQNYQFFPKHKAPLFWIDTLCVPVGEAEAHLRKRAIDQMASIYAASVQVLVLDAELLQCKVIGATANELLARVMCSAWMTRSWTLQEGVLGKECVFQFSDEALDLASAWCLKGARSRKSRRSGPPYAKQADFFPDKQDGRQTGIYESLYTSKALFGFHK